MAQYIDKDALVAKLKKEIKDIYAGREYVGIPSWEEREIDGLEKAIEILDTLEVKEVDLDAEFDKYCETLYLIDLENEPYAELFECAKYFFELGLNYKK